MPGDVVEPVDLVGARGRERVAEAGELLAHDLPAARQQDVDVVALRRAGPRLGPGRQAVTIEEVTRSK
ncbi:hypothetical protein [Nannocystis pusilla]|uniref:hypothetical protein n=1 Tax=Nannocystis pusilla TaxID=889268 RepID=UPI003B80A2A4